MPKGITLTPEQQTERRKGIIGIALRLIDENGFQKTSMREIAEMAGMGKSSLYDFFKTKDEIVVYAAEEEITAAIRNAKQIATQESMSPEKTLQEFMRHDLDYTKKNKSILMWLNAEFTHLDAEYQERLHRLRHTYQDILQSVITRGIAAGVFRETDAGLTARLLINSMLSIAYTSRPSSGPEIMLEETMNIFLNGIMR